jgi:hypothetical protein
VSAGVESAIVVELSELHPVTISMQIPTLTSSDFFGECVVLEKVFIRVLSLQSDIGIIGMK